jgi:hypothetical protein
MVHTANRITKHIVTAVIIAGLVIGSALFVINDTEPKWNGVPTYSVIGIIAAVILAFGMWKDFRKGDHDDWKGWEDDD